MTKIAFPAAFVLAALIGASALAQPVKPAQSDGNNAVRPAQSDGNNAVRPAQSDGNNAVRPAQSDGNNAVRPAQSDGNNAVRPAQSDGNNAVRPASSGAPAKTTLLSSTWFATCCFFGPARALAVPRSG